MRLGRRGLGVSPAILSRGRLQRVRVASQATWEREDHLRAQPVQLAGFRAPKGRAVLALDPLSTRRVRLFRRNRQ